MSAANVNTPLVDRSTQPTVQADQTSKFDDQPNVEKTWVNHLGKILVVLGIILIAVVAIGVATRNTDEDTTSSSASVVAEEMVRHFLESDAAVCGDGSTPTYYTRETGNENWIIFLEYGGSFCWNQENCDSRVADTPTAMTSDENPETKTDGGVLDTDPTMNPIFYNHSVISLSYCSSDYWWGTATPADSGTSYYFQGSLIIEEIINQVIADGVLDNAETITVWGQGAGGFGVLTQGDLIRNYLSVLGSVGEDVKMVMDSSWVAWTDSHFSNMTCSEASNCQLDISAPLLAETSLPRLSPRCSDQLWECIFAGHAALEDLTHPLLAFQWQYEVSQLASEGIFVVDETNQDFADSLRDTRLEEFETLPAGSGYHYPNCNDHEIATKDWFSVRGVVNDLSIMEAVDSWVREGTDMLNADDCEEMNCNPTCGAVVE